MAESSVHREVILRATQPSARMNYVSQTVLRDWWGLDVTWSQEAATPGWVVVIVAGEVVAAWPTHPIMRDEAGGMRVEFRGLPGTACLKTHQVLDLETSCVHLQAVLPSMSNFNFCIVFLQEFGLS